MMLQLPYKGVQGLLVKEIWRIVKLCCSIYLSFFVLSQSDQSKAALQICGLPLAEIEMDRQLDQ